MNIASVTIHVGDCLESLRKMPGASVHCVVTSPPYFGLRDYKMPGQIGLEKTPEQFVAALVEVFREARRVLRDDGVLWLNLGDSYAVNGGARTYGSTDAATGRGDAPSYVRRSPSGYKAKDLLGIPWMVAFALRADGWYLRQDIIWSKPNPMPESVTDRCTKAHEYIFLFSKTARYFYDAAAIAERAIHAGEIVMNDNGKNGQMEEYGATRTGFLKNGGVTVGEMRNKRSVWTVTTKPFNGAHFATFPPDLIRPCILAGCPAGGTVLDPFGGSGTTGMVAMELGRSAILCELNPDYAELCRKRCDVTPGFAI